jgi:ectoine hydroxylase-related dioxygenase (phytanoyl-CoA dioxygenase family)
LLFDQVFYKPGREGGSIAWHQDYSYMTYTQPMAHVTCWIALDDVTVDNGCLHYVRGSHRWGLLPRPQKLVDSDASVLDVLTEEQQAAFDVVPAEMPAGCASFHHPLLLHGSPPNVTDGVRRGLALHMMKDGTRAAEALPEIDGVPSWLLGDAGDFYPLEPEPKGPLLDGPYFPLL